MKSLTYLLAACLVSPALITSSQGEALAQQPAVQSTDDAGKDVQEKRLSPGSEAGEINQPNAPSERRNTNAADRNRENREERTERGENNQRENQRDNQRNTRADNDRYSAQNEQRAHLNLNRQLVAVITAANNAELKISRVAKQKAEHEAVKSYADQMISAHTRLSDDLKQVAQSQRDQWTQLRDQAQQSDLQRGSDQQRANRDNQTRSDERQANREENRADQNVRPHRRGENPLVKIQRDAIKTCSEQAVKELESKEGKEADWCYMTQQLHAHSQMIACLQAMEEHAEGELKDVISRTLGEMKDHKSKAEQVINDLKAEKKENKEESQNS